MKIKLRKKDKKDHKEKSEDIKYKERAAGGVVFYLNANNSNKLPKFLLLKHIGKKKHWDLPKGHIKKNETKEECAMREVSEETGIPTSKLKIIKQLNHKNIYAKRNSLRIKHRKIVYLYLFQASTDKIKLSDEHSDYKWVKFDQLEDKLTYPETSLLAFVESLDIIRNL